MHSMADGNEILKAINNFVQEESNDFLTQILREPLHQDTVMILVDAQYFKGGWTKQLTVKGLALPSNEACESLEKEHAE